MCMIDLYSTTICLIGLRVRKCFHWALSLFTCTMSSCIYVALWFSMWFSMCQVSVYVYSAVYVQVHTLYRYTCRCMRRRRYRYTKACSVCNLCVYNWPHYLCSTCVFVCVQNMECVSVPISSLLNYWCCITDGTCSLWLQKCPTPIAQTIT